MRFQKRGDTGQKFLDCIGIDIEEKIIGMKDTDLSCREYASIYSKHDQDTLAGEMYSTIEPFKDYKNKKTFLFTNKYPILNQEGYPIAVAFCSNNIQGENWITNLFYLFENRLPSENIPHFSIGKKSNPFHLTNREMECLSFLLLEKCPTAKIIARNLGISSRTVEDHLENIRDKFNCQNKSALIDKAIAMGYLNNIPTLFLKKYFAKKN